MTVKEFLSVVDWNTDVSIYQAPIKAIDRLASIEDYVLRQRASCYYAIHSNQNYLDYEVQNVKQIDNTIAIMCKANAEQEQRVSDAHNKRSVLKRIFV